MYRVAIEKLKAWKEKKNRKPLLINGARQVGKTWLACEFGKSNFDECAHVVFLDNAAMHNVFEGSLEPKRLLEAIAAQTNTHAQSGKCLVILDEIQECPRAIESLKLFCEQAPNIPIIAAGSLLGISLQQNFSFPVGKIDMLNLYPMSFYEFLLAQGKDKLAQFLDDKNYEFIGAFCEEFTDLYKKYLVIGGMPEVVQSFADEENFVESRRLQDTILLGYEKDFGKHANALMAEKIRLVWGSIASQLAKENKKFLYSAIKQGARARGYEEAIQWLIDAGLVHKVNRVKKASLPLKAYEDISAFKLFIHDVGLLGALAQLSPQTIFAQDPAFTEFKGAMSEQFVCQELIAQLGVCPFYWSAQNSNGEIDFLFEHHSAIVPCEVKATVNLKSKSLRAFQEKFKIERGVRLSLANYEKQTTLTNVPLYAIRLLN